MVTIQNKGIAGIAFKLQDGRKIVLVVGENKVAEEDFEAIKKEYKFYVEAQLERGIFVVEIPEPAEEVAEPVKEVSKKKKGKK